MLDPLGLVFLAYLMIMLAILFVVNARRPADDRALFIRRLPPASQPLPVRSAHLRHQLRQELWKHLKIGVWIAPMPLVFGVCAALDLNRSVGDGVAATAFTAAMWFPLYEVIAVSTLLGRYLSARRRILYDAEWRMRRNEAVPPL